MNGEMKRVLREAEKVVEDAHNRKEYRPVAVAIIENDSGEILFVQSAKNKSVWYPPQGGIGKGESIVEALFREIHEELGVDKKNLRLLEYLGTRDLDAERGREDKRGFTRGKKYFFFKLRIGKRVEITLDAFELSGYQWVGHLELRKIVAAMRKEKGFLIEEMILRKN